MMFLKKLRIKNLMLLRKIKKTPCVACWKKPVDPAHIQTRGSGGDDVEENLMALCRLHHIEQHQIGWFKMKNRYIGVDHELFLKGWLFDENGKLFRR